MRGTLQELTEVRHAQYVMGTLVEITAYTDDRDQDSALLALQEAMREFEVLEQAFSRFDPASEISHLNRNAGASAFPVSPMFFEVVDCAMSYSRLSGGSFSIALAPLVSLWGSCAKQQCWPANEKVRSALERSDCRFVELDSRHFTIRFGLPGMGLNLDGFVKGVATDRARSILQRSGIPRAVINAGSSSLSAYGFGRGDICRVGLRDPACNQRVVALCRLRNESLSSSGTGEQQYSLGGWRLSHLIDPRSGYPLEGVFSATAFTQSAALAEVASKMLLFLGNAQADEIFEAVHWCVAGIRLESVADGQEIRFEYSPAMEVEVLRDSCSTVAH